MNTASNGRGSGQAADFPVYPTAIIVLVLSAVTIVLDMPPLIWHFRHRNVGACCLVFWLLLLNLMNVVNAVIWPTDNLDKWWRGAGLCDVEIRLMIGALVALPGALACIMRSLANVMDTKRTAVVPTPSQKRRQYVLDLLLCFGCPLYLMLVYYVVQDKRYYIWGITGCNVSTDNSWVSVALVLIWPPLFSLVDAYYAGESATIDCVVVYRLYRYRQEFSRLLQASNTNTSRFLRLFVMSLVLILAILPLQLYIFVLNVDRPRTHYSWREVHNSSWNAITMVPSNGAVAIDHWVRIACGFLVFFFFGFGTDAVSMYRSWLVKLGFAKIFPRLGGRHSSISRQGRSWTSFGSKARWTLSSERSHNTSNTDNRSRDSAFEDFADTIELREGKRISILSRRSDLSSSHNTALPYTQRPVDSRPEREAKRSSGIVAGEYEKQFEELQGYHIV